MKENIEIKSIKIGLVGDTHVGRYSICETYITGESVEYDFCRIWEYKNDPKIKLKNGKEIKLVISRINGLERFHSIALGNLTKLHGVIIVFSFSDKKSFDDIQYWINRLNEIGIKNYAIFGNKIDLPKNQWEIKSEEAKKYAQENNIAYFETSCKTREGIDEGFSYFANELYEKLIDKNSNNINIKKEEKLHESNCAGKKNKK